MAQLGKGELEAARAELAQVRTLADDTTLATTIVGFNPASAANALTWLDSGSSTTGER